MVTRLLVPSAVADIERAVVSSTPLDWVTVRITSEIEASNSATSCSTRRERARRCSVSAAWAARKVSASAILSLNTASAAAMWPISSSRLVSGIAMSRRFRANTRMVSVIAPIGATTVRASTR